MESKISHIPESGRISIGIHHAYSVKKLIERSRTIKIALFRFSALEDCDFSLLRHRLRSCTENLNYHILDDGIGTYIDFFGISKQRKRTFKIYRSCIDAFTATQSSYLCFLISSDDQVLQGTATTSKGYIRHMKDDALKVFPYGSRDDPRPMRKKYVLGGKRYQRLAGQLFWGL